MKPGPLKYHGGKSYLAKWLHSLAPPSVQDDPINGYTHRLHPFAGGLGELWAWDHEGISETVNDLDGAVSNFWQVLRHEPSFLAMERTLGLTPFSHPEWENMNRPPRDNLEAAVYFFVRNRQSRQGLGKCFATPTRRTRRGMNENVSAYLAAIEGLPEFHQRLRRVEIQRMDAIRFIEGYDHPRAFFYCDPPYLHSTRVSKHAYTCEIPADYHQQLLETLANIQGRFMLSGYLSDMYESFQAKHGWKFYSKQIDNKASGSKSKRLMLECVWCNYSARYQEP